MGAKSKRRRTKGRFHRRTEPGAPPGTLVPDPTAPRYVLTVHGVGYTLAEPAP